MVFSKKEHSILFILVCITLFFGISSFMLINDWVRLPRKQKDFTILVDLRSKLGLNCVYPDYWEINSFDGKITNIEHIIIWVLMFWGFLRLIDLGRLIFVIK
jgi:hypothetical protein